MNRAGVAPERVRVLDPQQRPLEMFWRVTAATGMSYLRSPSVHNVDLHPFALTRFAKKGGGKRLARFVYPYGRPGLEFFRAHTEHVVRKHELDSLRQQCRAQAITRLDNGYRVETDVGAIDSRRVILALGLGEQLCMPAWARKWSERADARSGAQPFEGDARVKHIFSASFSREATTAARSVAIIGGGISAAQLACALAKAEVDVTIVARHAPRIHLFDSDPEWLGPKAMVGFSRTRDPNQRRNLIAAARHRGSIPPEIAGDLRDHLRSSRIKWLQAEPVAADAVPGGVQLRLDRTPHHLEIDQVVLATGFELHRPGGALLDANAIDRLGLPCADCGYPIVSPRLEWANGLFVTGPLAELELGPTARNIAGARAAAERLLAAA